MKSLWGQKNRYLRIKQRKLDISPRLARALFATILVMVSVIFIAGDVGLWNLWNAQKRLEKLNMEIKRVERENQKLKKGITELTENPFTIEKIARERYGYLRPGDRVYRIITLPLNEKSTEKDSYPLDRGKKKL